jgi:hypothetical protein
VAGEDALRRDYWVAFLRFLDSGEESALTDGYKLGRRALSNGVSLLEITKVHHEVILEALGGHAAPEAVATAGSSFLLEVLSSYEMQRRT